MPSITPDAALMKVLGDVMDEEGRVKTYAFVRIVNNGDKDFRGQQAMYGNEEFPIPVGGDNIVPYLAMCLWMGDPRTVNVPGDTRKKYREDEWHRLRNYYGVYDAADPNTFTHPNLPLLTAFTLTGQRIVTVLDDPYGDQLSSTGEAVIDKEQEMEMLKRALAESIEGQKRVEARLDMLVKHDSGITSGGIDPDVMQTAAEMDKAFATTRPTMQPPRSTEPIYPGKGDVVENDGIPTDSSLEPAHPATKNIGPINK